jgi:hypothetical protein
MLNFLLSQNLAMPRGGSKPGERRGGRRKGSLKKLSIGSPLTWGVELLDLRAEELGVGSTAVREEPQETCEAVGAYDLIKNVTPEKASKIDRN